MNKLPILFVRYAPGAAGNFFISSLQTSSRVSCWNTQIEQTKHNEFFEQEFKKWFQNCFQSDLPNHIKHEPHHPYRLDFFSSKHPRGNDISISQFVEHLVVRNDHIFLDNIKRNQLTVMRLNKPVIPLFGYGNTVINIIVDPPAKKWFYHARLIKLFGHDHNHGWITKENHPEFLAAKFKNILFRNQYYYKCSKFKFLKDFVVGEPAIRPFFSETSLLQDSSNNFCKQISINLSVIFDKNLFLSTMIEIFKTLELGQPNLALLEWIHDHYAKINICPFADIIDLPTNCC